jgi:hypothetical protein
MQTHASGIGASDAADHPPEGALAGAVFANQGMHLARVNVETDLRERLHAGVRFG